MATANYTAIAQRGFSMATIKQRTAKDGSTYYTAEVRLKGHNRETATFRRLTDAKKWIASTESAIREGRHFKSTEAKKHTLAEAIDRYCKEVLPKEFTSKEQRNRRPILAWWKEETGIYLMADLSSDMLECCREKLKEKTNKSGKPFSSQFPSAHDTRQSIQ